MSYTLVCDVLEMKLQKVSLQTDYSTDIQFTFNRKGSDSDSGKQIMFGLFIGYIWLLTIFPIQRNVSPLK